MLSDLKDHLENESDLWEYSGPCMFCFAGAWMLAFAYNFLKVFMDDESWVDAPIEWIYAVLLIAAIIFGLFSDLKNNQVGNLKVVLIGSIVIHLLMHLLASFGVAVLLGAFVLIVGSIWLSMTIGEGAFAIWFIIADAL